ncbi:unnamed protein product [Cylicocyclus nassatus]|uniref:Uncharacterized protein n=1 Tax=Cylicocyclus nassatus TaxID=53992 RepID=A0AA36ME92_CYLNA|nr:unnamed protein product [Cylicocyclus nassatus]
MLARTLRREAIMAGLGKMETYVDRRQYCESDIFGEDSVGERTEGQRKDDGWVGRDFRSSLETTRIDDEERNGNSESVSPLSDLSSEGWKHTRRDGGRADLQEEGGRVGGTKRSPPLIPPEELAEIRKRRIMQQLEDFDSDCSSSPQHRNSASTKQVTKLQMELLKEERAIFTKVSIAMDKLLTVLDRQLELSNALFERIRGSDNAVAF